LIKHTQTTTETLYSRTHTQWENGKKTKEEKMEIVFRDDGKILGCEIPVTVSTKIRTHRQLDLQETAGTEKKINWVKMTYNIDYTRPFRHSRPPHNTPHSP
jgi:hypothetical protein